ncbi:Inhibin beta A chain [Trichinella zimbabwensis]|uniref:Inhibin beta A chain n=1 Tax=Trichinella zimbabwensis TaxID=268475 RepID=A0A0V1H4F9_9BILA|nr:Inhibin beta A chain [Trichinella zimbabwensis]
MLLRNWIFIALHLCVKFQIQAIGCCGSLTNDSSIGQSEKQKPFKEILASMDRLHQLLTVKRIVEELNIPLPLPNHTSPKYTSLAQIAFHETVEIGSPSLNGQSSVSVITLEIAGIPTDANSKSVGLNNDHELLHHTITLNKSSWYAFNARPIAVELLVPLLQGQQPCRALFEHVSCSNGADRTWNVDSTNQIDRSACEPFNITLPMVQQLYNSARQRPSTADGNVQIQTAIRILGHKLHARNYKHLTPVLRVRLQKFESTTTTTTTTTTTSSGYRTKRKVKLNFNKSIQSNKANVFDVVDCEKQWDAAFLSSTSPAIYDDLMPCCRRRFRISFDELGWGDWVLAPKQFDSYYCIGRCTHFGGFSTENGDGFAFYSELMNLYRSTEKNYMKPCCSPIKFAPLTIAIWQGPNEQATQTLDNVVVTKCGCI